MTSAAEAMGAKGQLAAGLEAGVNTLSENQDITFTLYVRKVLPLDGYVFWVKATLTEDPPAVTSISVNGSLHFATDQAQREDETFGVNHVVFTSMRAVGDFNAIQPQTMWLGSFEGIRFAFSRRASFYRQADLHHYVGDAIYPAFLTQVIDTPEALAALADDEPIVTNSLPIWLSLDDLVQPFPSFLVGENIAPPYAAIHIEPTGTQVFSAAPVIDQMSNHWQLARDRVRITLYGLNNAQALAYLDSVLAFMEESEVMGLVNMPTVRDGKRMQSELTALAKQKFIDFEVTYYQQSALDIARQLILHATVAIQLGH